MYIYADNAGTTKMSPVAIDAMTKCMNEVFGNPSSLHSTGQRAAEVLQKAREDVAEALGADFNEIYFTSGGSEADNQAIRSAALFGAKKGKKHLISTKIEHHAVLHTLKKLEREGFEVTLLDVGADGIVDPADVEKAIREDTALVTIMYANNEIGTLQPIDEIAKICKEKKVTFHTDAVQAFGQVPINVDECHIDMLSASGHKLNGPKGIGFLYIRKGVKIRSFVHGGAQERKRRAGTENVPGIAGLGLATKMIYNDLDMKVALMRELKDYFIEQAGKIENTTVHGLKDEGSAPHIISVGFAGIRSEVLLHTLEEKGIYVSSGSACASNHPAISGVLKGIGAGKEYLDATLRFSMSEFTTEEEIDYTLETLYNCVPMLRKYTRH